MGDKELKFGGIGDADTSFRWLLGVDGLELQIEAPQKDTYLTYLYAGEVSELRDFLNENHKMFEEPEVPSKEDFVLSYVKGYIHSEGIPRDALVEAVLRTVGATNNPFPRGSSESDVISVITDLFFARKIVLDKYGAVAV